MFLILVAFKSEGFECVQGGGVCGVGGGGGSSELGRGLCQHLYADIRYAWMNIKKYSCLVEYTSKWNNLKTNIKQTIV